MSLKCACGDKECPIEIMFDEERLIFIDRRGNECLIYLDANLICDLSNKLQSVLLKLAQNKFE